MTKNSPKESDAVSEKLANLLAKGEKEIRQRWYGALKQGWGAESFEKWKSLEGAGEGADLLSFFSQLFERDSVVTSEEVVAFLKKLRLNEYFFSDFFLEISLLQSAILDYLKDQDKLQKNEVLKAVSLLHSKFSQLLQILLSETSEIYEYITKRGGRGVCQLDSDGRITSHNRKMEELLGRSHIKGEKLESFFHNQDEKEFIRSNINRQPGQGPAMRKLRLQQTEGEETIPVGTEIAPLVISGRSRGAYACLIDITMAEREFLRVFERSPLGILQANLSGEITYANEMLLEIMGIEEWKGKTIKDIIGPGDALSQVEEGLERRKRGLSDEYQVDIIRPDKQMVPVMISAGPVTDLNRKPTGTMAIVRSMKQEQIVASIYKHIGEERNWKILLEKVAEEIQKMVSYDLAFVARYSGDGVHSRVLIQYPQTDELQWSRRWWELSEATRHFVNQKRPVFDNLDEFLSKEEWKDLREDTEFKRLLETGVRSFLFLPVLKGGKVAASITLFSNAENAFDSKDEKVLDEMPLDSAVHMALFYQDEEELMFRLGLISELSSVSNNIDTVARVMVAKIGKHYEWDNVSLFRVDETSKEVVLEQEFASRESFKLGPNFTQKIGKGLLGQVMETGEMTCVPDMDSGEFKDVCIRALKESRSELCLPINISGHVRWLLNIEDSHQNAFSEENKTALEEIGRKLEGLMTRARTQHFLTALLENASDGILTTDGKGMVAKANPAWADMLGYSHEELEGRDVLDFFSSKEEGNNLLEGPLPNQKILLRHADGDTVEVLLSISELPKALAGKILIAKDLALAKRMEELEYLGKMYYEIATQTKTPLSLIFTWLDGLKEQRRDDGDTIDKIIRQLKRVDLTFDRLAFYGEEEEEPPKKFLLDIKEVVDKVLSDIPEKDREQIVDEFIEPLPLLRGEIYQLYFCFQSILSYLLRFLPENKRIKWKTWTENDRLVSEVSGYFPPQPEEKPDDLERTYRISKTLLEMATGKAVVERFIKEHEGELFDPRIEGDTMTLRIQLPIAQDE
jgi:PAS domain S-box-containing protein